MQARVGAEGEQEAAREEAGVIPASAIIAQAEEFGRCACPVCLRLDQRFPNEGYQLALFRYVISLAPPPGTGLQHFQSA